MKGKVHFSFQNQNGCALELGESYWNIRLSGYRRGCGKHSHGRSGVPRLNPPSYDSVTFCDKMNLVALIEIRMLNGENGLCVLNVNTTVLRDEDRGRKIRGSDVQRCYVGGFKNGAKGPKPTSMVVFKWFRRQHRFSPEPINEVWQS